MKKIFKFSVITTLLFCSCASKQATITYNNTYTDEKRDEIIKNTNLFASANIVGSGGNIANKEKEETIKSQINKRKLKLLSIPGIFVDTGNGLENGLENNKKNETDKNYQFRITISNDKTFKVGSSELDEGIKGLLEELAIIINEYPTRIKIVGHTDNSGGGELNKKLSKERATAVANFLIEKGIQTDMITTEGKSFNEPVGDNRTEVGRKRNRRVEILLSSFDTTVNPDH